MSTDFNPYHVWLSIPPEEQPANHYRLLGIRLFETNGDVIDSAADRQMAHLRTFQSGKHGDLTQRLLNEVAAARVCLLDIKKRAAYDQQLQAQSATSVASAQAGTAPATSGSAIHRQPPRRPAGPSPAVAPTAEIPRATAAPQPADQWDDLLGDSKGDPSGKPAHRPGGKSAAAAKSNTANQRDAKNRTISIAVAAAVVIIAAVGIGLFAMKKPSDGTLLFDWPVEDRASTTVSVDGTPLPAPAEGAWAFHGAAGSHHIVAEHLAYKLDANVDLAAGEQQTVPAEWKPKATLVLNWPTAQRTGAELRIDGRLQAASQRNPLEVPVEPGPHVVQITRRGVAPIFVTANVAEDGRGLATIPSSPSSPAIAAAAKLVFDWPADQRTGAELMIDGSRQTVPIGPSDAPFALALAPGQHVVHITRPDFKPFDQTIDLMTGASLPVKPVWTPERKTAPAVVETTVPAETTTAQPVKKQPVPAAADQERVAKQLDDLYKTSRSGSGVKDPAKAQEMYDVAAKGGNSPAERYMLLTKGAEIAAAGGDLNLSFQGIDTLDTDYEINALETKQRLFDKFVAANKGETLAAALPTAEQLIDQAVAADQYEIALVLSTTAGRAVAKSQIPARKAADERLSRRRQNIHLLEPLFSTTNKAQETLEKNPADPGANLAVGRWRCLYKQDWASGLPSLAKGSDEKLKSLAASELTSPNDPDQQLKLADGWWDQAQKETGLARDSLRLHAGEIYNEALPNLTSVLKKAAIEKRLADIADLKPITTAVATNSSAGAGNSIDVGNPAGAGNFPLNQWVDVLRLVDTTKNAVVGKWSRNGKAISVEQRWGARIAIPVAIEGSYDLEVGFNSNDTEVAIPVGSHGLSIMLGGHGGTVSGFDTLDGRRPSDENPITVRSNDLMDGHQFLLLVKVRNRGGDLASIDVLLNGKPFLPHWKGSPSALAVYSAWTMPTLNHPGLGAWDTRATFSSVRLRMISGHASADDSTGKSTAESVPPQPVAPLIAPDKSAGAIDFPLGKAVEILQLVDATKDVFAGTWSRDGDKITVEPGNQSRIVFPFVVEGSYDLEVEFNRAQGIGDLMTTIPVGSSSCNVMTGHDGHFGGLDMVEKERPLYDDSKNPTRVTSPEIENDHVYHLLVKVRSRSADQASIDVLLDGKPYLPHWEGNPSALSVSQDWAMPSLDHLGLGAWRSQVTYSSVKLRMISGRATAEAASKPSSGSSDGSGQLRFKKWAYTADERGIPGYFEQRDEGWIEMKNGAVWARFKEVARTPDFVELFDKGRGLSVRLTLTEASWSRDKTTWNVLAKGSPSTEP